MSLKEERTRVAKSALLSGTAIRAELAENPDISSPFKRVPTKTFDVPQRGGSSTAPLGAAFDDGNTVARAVRDLIPASTAGNPEANAAPVPDFASFQEGDFPEETTSPGMIPASASVREAVEKKRGEIRHLLSAIGPFLWSLEEAAKWVKEVSEKGQEGGGAHARSLSLLAKILGQLQARIDELHRLEGE